MEDKPKKPPIKKRGTVNTPKATMQRVRNFKKTTKKQIDELIDAARIERDNIKKLQREREKVEKELKEREELIKTAPTIKEQQKLVAALFRDQRIEPIQKLIDLAESGELPPRDTAMIWKYLSEFTTPKPKSVDTQKDESMNLSVQIVDFSGARQDDLKNQAEVVSDEEYDEFTLKEDQQT